MEGESNTGVSDAKAYGPEHSTVSHPTQSAHLWPSPSASVREGYFTHSLSVSFSSGAPSWPKVMTLSWKCRAQHSGDNYGIGPFVSCHTCLSPDVGEVRGPSAPSMAHFSMTWRKSVPHLTLNWRVWHVAVLSPLTPNCNNSWLLQLFPTSRPQFPQCGTAPEDVTMCQTFPQML